MFHLFVDFLFRFVCWMLPEELLLELSLDSLLLSTSLSESKENPAAFIGPEEGPGKGWIMDIGI